MGSKVFAALALSAFACGGNPPAELPSQAAAANAASPITQRDWVLQSLGSLSVKIDTTRPPTLRLDTADVRATGFAGCNRYFASYTLRADSLTFGPVGSTKMFCAETDDLERAFLSLLSGTATYQVSDSILTLRTRDGLEARFRPARQ